MADLAHRSGVDKSTIFRIENGSAKTTRVNILDKLAKGLGVPLEELTSCAAPVHDQQPAPKDKSQVSFRLENNFRNAFSLLARRYSVSPTTVIKLAPLLFVMVAEDSLRRRKERLSALRAAQKAYGPVPSHYIDDTRQFEWAEENSILSRDVFGRQLDDDMEQDFWPPDADAVGRWNPFEVYINEWFERIGETGGISYWGESGLEYSVCLEEALSLACGDEMAAKSLLDGDVGIHELPDEFRSAENASQRLEWLRSRIAAVNAEREKRIQAFRTSATGARLAKLLGESSTQASTGAKGE